MGIGIFYDRRTGGTSDVREPVDTTLAKFMPGGRGRVAAARVRSSNTMNKTSSRVIEARKPR